METTEAIRADIVARLQAIPAIGIVHAYQRYAAREAQLKELYVHDGRLSGWFVRRTGVSETSLPAKQTLETARWLIRGYRAVDDAGASELAFDALIDQIRAAFLPYSINPAPLDAVYRDAEGKQTGAALDESVPVLFAGILCHSAKITLITRRFIQYPR